MPTFAGIEKNFRLMIVQVRKQLESTLQLLDDPDPKLTRAIRHSDDYIDTQKSMIENECFKILSQQRIDDAKLVDFIRAINVITSNLERIADFSANIARQSRRLGDHAVLERYDYRAYIERLLEGIDFITEALFQRKSSLGLRIGYIEDELDRLYRAHLAAIIHSLRGTQHVDDIITVLFILHYLERMGDALKNIGEAIILAVLGERLKIHQYRVLDEALDATPQLRQPITDVNLASIWGTRSGVRIGTVEGPGNKKDADAQRVVFKEGNPEKLQQERDSLDRWGEVAPGLAPVVVEYQEQQRGAALLLEYMDGTTLQDILLNADAEIIRRALDRLENTLNRVWSSTRRDAPVHGDYMRQLRARIDDVYRLHPRLDGPTVQLGALRIEPFPVLLAQIAGWEAELRAPFSVFIHGDFNIDNIIYNRRTDRVHLVDTHRSRDMDYVQDVSVYAVSNFRLPVFVPKMRQTLEAAALRMLQFARRFAQQHGDTTFEARLALGLIRSLVTSTRFELDTRFARQMHQRAILLMHRLVAHRGQPWDTFTTPDSILVY
jgi:phosphate uptake regulator/Ser/Thr protein kinase RdoA (MazF antagonist)